MQQVSQYLYIDPQAFSDTRDDRLSRNPTKPSLEPSNLVSGSFTKPTVGPSLSLSLPRTWQDAESIQSIITSWAGIERPRAHALSQSASECSTQTFSYHNKTLNETCPILLTCDNPAPKDLNRPDQADHASTVHNFVAGFLARLPSCTRNVSKAANPWIFVDLFLPPGQCKPAARALGASFWIWLCIVDDLTEDGDEHADLDACSSILSGNLYDVTTADPPPTPCLEVMMAFQETLRTVQFDDLTLAGSESSVEEWKTDLWNEVHTCCYALKAEQQLHGREITIREWLAQRLITISTRPFLVLFRASCRLPTALSSSTTTRFAPLPTLSQLQLLLQALLGLQNDLLGWEKDHRQGNPLNAVQVLISSHGGAAPAQAFHAVVQAHNDLMRVYVALAAEYLDEMTGPQVEQAMAYLDLMTNCGHAMAAWMMGCGRYIIPEDDDDADVREVAEQS